jgi:hypothetical protein
VGAFIGAVFKVAGIVQTFLWLGGSVVLAAIAGTVAWVAGLTNAALLTLLVVGFFFLSGAVILIVLRNLPSDWYLFRSPLPGAALAAPAQPAQAQPVQQRRVPLPAIPSPQQQLTYLIEEGERLRQRIPRPPENASQRFVHTMLGYDIDYPARVYEWETRAWNYVSRSPRLAQYRGLFNYSSRAQRLGTLDAHMIARLDELRQILGRV